MYSLNQGAWVSGTDRYEYGHRSAANVSITGAPDDANLRRWAMLHDGSAYRLYIFQGSSRDTLYQFSWNGSSYAYGHNSMPIIKLTNMPDDADSSSLSMLHGDSRYTAYLRRLGDPTILHQFIWVPGTANYEWGHGNAISSLKVTGFPDDTDWSRWSMLHDGSYRIYALHHGNNEQISQGSWNPSAREYQYGFNSMKQLKLVNFPENSDVGLAAMLHDNSDYRFYFQTL